MTRLALCAIAAFMLTALFAGSGGEARAQGYSQRYYEPAPRERVYRERRGYDDDDAYFERRMRYYSRGEVARRNSERRTREVEVEQPRSGLNFFQRLFGGGSNQADQRSDQGAVEVRPAKRIPRRRPPTVAARPPAPTPADPAAAVAAGVGGAAVGAAVAAVPQAGVPAPAAPVQPTTFVAVIGDSIADQLANGLQEGFADAPELTVKRATKPNSGLVREDYFDIVKEIEKLLAQGPVTYAVFEAGVNDRQPFLDLRKEPPLSDAWRKRYADRIDAVLAPFKARKIPIFWTGLAPSEANRATADHVAINAIARERVEAAGGTYVDIWEGFVDEDGLYAETGPMLDGQTGRLRLDDGVHFSKAGARKLAHYVEQEIRKVFQPKTATPDAVMAAIAPEAGATAIQPAPTAEQPRPISSPLMVLTAPRKSQGGALAAAAPTPIPARDASQSAAKFLVNGESPEADAGRMDDHRWPGAEQPAPEGAKTTEVKASPAPPAAQPATLIDPRPLEQQGAR